MSINARFRPGTIKLAPILIPRTRYECFSKPYIRIIQCVYVLSYSICNCWSILFKFDVGKYSLYAVSPIIFTHLFEMSFREYNFWNPKELDTLGENSFSLSLLWFLLHLFIMYYIKTIKCFGRIKYVVLRKFRIFLVKYHKCLPNFAQIVWLLLKVGMVLFNIDFWHTKHLATKLATILKDRYSKFCLKFQIKEKSN